MAEAAELLWTSTATRERGPDESGWGLSLAIQDPLQSTNCWVFKM